MRRKLPLQGPMSFGLLIMLVVLVATSACASSTATTATTGSTSTPNNAATPSAATPSLDVNIHLQPFAQGLDSPLYLTSAPGQSDRVYVVEQTGRILVLGMDGKARSQPFLDISSLISTGGERGLLSVAFHPDYARNGYFYVDYTNTNGDTVVARYHVSSSDPYRADPQSAMRILFVDQPAANHNGGLLLFGPDGYLYVGMGDGGFGASANGQRKNTLLGKVLRIDVDHTAGNQQYAIPADNLFVNQAGTRPEIWAYGLRNPWRFSFDRTTGDLFIGDVGENTTEEIDYQPAGKGGADYGWAIREGDACYTQGDACSTPGLTGPVAVYRHAGGNCTVAGGYVYRGAKYPTLRGVYLFGDYCSGRVWLMAASDAVDGKASTRQALDTDLQIVSFGEDAAGELYVVSIGGTVYRVTV